jgi:hypothetical protein
MQILAEGSLRKMKTVLGDCVEYTFVVGQSEISATALIGRHINLSYKGNIECVACGRVTKKSFNQGHCYPCLRKLASCDVCIMSPEKCHFSQGTCREPEWAEQFCKQDHVVYLANTTGLKVGITRGDQVPTRWMDQGAVQALPIFKVSQRYYSGLVEVVFKQFVKDRTQWQRMLKGEPEYIDIKAQAIDLKQRLNADIDKLQADFGLDQIQSLDDMDVVNISYPVLNYPEKVKALNFDKTPDISGQLLGIKGQYLILDSGVLNIRKFSAYNVMLSAID